MSFTLDRPVPYIRIVDVSPYRSSLRKRPTANGAARRHMRRIAAAVLAVVAAVAIASAVGAASVSSDPAADFGLAPGHAMRAALDVSLADENPR